MSVSLVINGVTYPFPEQGDEDWGLQATDAIVAITNGMLQKAGGNFTLLADTNFGATYGLVSTYYKSRSSNIADAGVLRLAVGDSILWRNNANSANIGLSVDASDKLNFNGSEIIAGLSVSDSTNIDLTLSGNDISASIIAGSIVNADISASAAIEYSKLLLTGSILNADISNSAAIAYSKLNLASSIVDADISGSAAINLSKLSIITASRALQSSGSGVIEASAVTSTELGYVAGVTSSLQTQINAKADDSALTAHTGASSGVHGVTGNVVGTTDSQTLSNKTLTSPSLTTPSTDIVTLDGQASQPSTPSSGFYKVYVDDTSQQLTILNSLGQATSIGAGGGTGINFIENGEADTGTTGWVGYANAAGTAPVDGTGGTATDVDLSTTTTTPLSGDNSFLYSKGLGVNAQGQGYSYDFMIDRAYLGKVLTITFDYIINSGFVAGTPTTDSSMTVWIYDIDNAVLIQPSAYKLLSNSSTVPDRFQAEFQSSLGNEYRLILHNGTTDTSGYQLMIDNVSVSPNEYVFGSPFSDPSSYTPIFTGFGTVTNILAKQHREGKYLVVEGTATVGTATATPGKISLPAGMAIDTTSISTANSLVGEFSYNGDLTTTFEYTLVAAPATAIDGVYLTRRLGSSSNTPLTLQNANVLIGTGDVSFKFKVPIAGQSSSVQMADQTSTRVVAAKITGNAAVASSGNVLIVPTVEYDTHAAYDATTGRYTVPVSGYYKIYGALKVSTGGVQMNIYKNAVISSFLGLSDNVSGGLPISGSVFAIAGDILDIRPNTSATMNLSTSSVTYERVSGPSQIASSETVAAKAAGDPASVDRKSVV